MVTGNYCLECRWCVDSVVEDGIRYAKCVRADGFDVSGGLVSSLRKPDCWEERMGDRCGNCVWKKTNAEGYFWCGNEESSRLGTVVSDRDVCDHWIGSERVENAANDSNGLNSGKDKDVPTKNDGCSKCIYFCSYNSIFFDKDMGCDTVGRCSFHNTSVTQDTADEGCKHFKIKRDVLSEKVANRTESGFADDINVGRKDGKSCGNCVFEIGDECWVKGEINPDGFCDEWNSGPLGDAFSDGYGPSDRGSVLGEAFTVINGERQDSYGNPEDCFKTIADLWTAYVKTMSFSSHDVAMMMALMKVARISHGAGDRDSYRDCAGYLGLACDMVNARDVEKE